ncbi:hypothetical protein PVAND_004620 [Polypedilum vanderplanki]|uniref:TIMELESS-interacting protein n=1 Tax=Polypedilum vanderplanki TaxID=319348 RepID=A0A9J6BYN9_POLVA|nr:hypothetical protein PVAND_004620 [Polypedilum vanderplanki]
MSAIDLYEDFNDIDDALMGDSDEDDNNRNQENIGNNEDNDQEQDGAEAAKVDVVLKPKGPKRKLVTLNAEKLKGPRGIIAIDDFFKNMKFKGKGREKEDLNEIMKRLEHWCHRMFPKYHFDDALAKIERLGRKREVQVHMQRYRMDQLTRDDENKVMSDNEDNDMLKDTLANENPVDEFEELLNEQIALSTTHNINATSISHDQSFGNMSGISSSTQLPRKVASPQVSDEQRVKIEENRKKALEIRAAKLRQAEEKKKQIVITQEVDDDEFDQLLQEQMAMQQMSTLTQDSTVETNPIKESSQSQHIDEIPKPFLNDEQRAKIEENRRKALEIRAAKMKIAKDAKKPKINIIIDDDFC